MGDETPPGNETSRSPEPRDPELVEPEEPDAFWQDPEVVQRFAEKDPDHRLRELVEDYPKPALVHALDLGCAGGRNAVLLAEKGFDLVAVDASEAMVEETRRRVAEVLGEAEARRRVRRGLMDHLPWLSDGAVDLVVALGIWHQADSREEWDRALDETARITAPGGRVLVSVFSPGTNLAGEEMTPVPGDDRAYEGFPSGRGCLADPEALDEDMARRGFEPERPTERVVKELEDGRRRVSANGLYVFRIS